MESCRVRLGKPAEVEKQATFVRGMMDALVEGALATPSADVERFPPPVTPNQIGPNNYNPLRPRRTSIYENQSYVSTNDQLHQRHMRPRGWRLVFDQRVGISKDDHLGQLANDPQTSSCKNRGWVYAARWKLIRVRLVHYDVGGMFYPLADVQQRRRLAQITSEWIGGFCLSYLSSDVYCTWV